MKISTQFVTIVTSTAIAGLLIFSNVVQAQDGRGNNNARNQADNRGDNRNNRNNNPNNIEEVEEVIETPEEIEEVEEIPEEVIEVVEPVTIPSSIEAELFTTQEGIRLEDGIQDGDSHVAYIQDGDFTEYNIVVPNNGNYNIEAIVASNTNGGTITIEVNGIDINSMDVSNTGGWQNWTTVSTNLELEAGEQTLRLAYSGGNSYLLNVDAFTIAFGEAIETPVEPVVEEPAIETVNTIASIAALGELIFTDTNLSLNRTQSCSTCHNPDNGWIDDRDNGINSSVSLGDDEISLGNRNSPTIAYAAFIPDFNGNNRNANGGLFWDGRAEDLVSQAGQPFTNPIEMGMPDENSVIDRILENPEYVAAFEDFFGDGVFDNTDTAFTAVSEAIAT